MRSANASASCFHPQETSGKRGASTVSFFKQVALGHHPGFHGVPQQHDMHRRCPGRMSGCRGPIADLETNSFSGEFAFHDCLRRSWALSGTAGGCCCLSFHGSAGGMSRTAGGLLRECWSTAGELLGGCCGAAGGLLVESLGYGYCLVLA